MATINTVIVEGNLVKAAELSRWGDNSKGPYAESMAKHLLKGRRVTVQGRLKQQRWTDTNGNKRTAIVVKVSEISLAPFGNNNFRPSQEQQSPSDYVENEPETYSNDMFDGSEEIPF